MMTTQDQRIALAEWDGWNSYKCGASSVAPGKWRLVPPNPKQLVAELFETREEAFVEYTPDYPSDLNAVHELEKKLTEQQRLFYMRKLIQDESVDDAFHVTNGMVWDMTHANAAQRCEALCRMLWPERWKD